MNNERRSVWSSRDDRVVKHVSAILDAAPQNRGTALTLAPPASLTPADAASLGSELLAAGAPDHAFSYLVRGLERPTAFAWCRLGKLCRTNGYPLYATRCYDEALLLEPGNRFAIVARAAALADDPDATIQALVVLPGEVVSAADG